MKTKTILIAVSLFAVVSFVANPVGAQSTKTEPASIGTLNSSDLSLDRQRVAAVPKSEDSKFEFTEAELRAFEKSTFALINRRRVDAGLPEMAWSEDAAKVARLHSTNMAQLKFFGHKGADGKMVDERADQLGVRRWKAIGENIAYLRGYNDPVTTVVEKWMLSSGHRTNLLNPRWKESAIGVAITEDGTYYLTQVFLERR